MSKVNEIMLARNQGIAYALDKVKTEGIEALEEEAKYRNVTGMTMSKAEIKENYHKVANTAVLIAITSTIEILQDTYCFTDKQTNDFITVYQQRVNELSNDTDKLAECITKQEIKGINIMDF